MQQNHTGVYRFSFESVSIVATFHQNQRLLDGTAITAKIRAILKEECVKVIDNFVRRVQVCLQRNGGHLEHILGKP